MVHPAHEKLLRSGGSAWNDWRRRNGSVVPELSGLKLAAADLVGCELHHARLDSARLIRTRLAGADLRYADLRGAQLHEADLSDADLYRANLDGAVLAGAKLRRARLYGASLRETQITVADLRRADLREARLERADLRESLAAGASFEGADFTGAELALCQLAGSNLLGARGLSSRAIESAIVDASTLLPGELESLHAPRRTVEALAGSLRALVARATDDSVPESVVESYHAVLDRLEEQGVALGDARIEPRELVRPVGASAGWADGALFRTRISSLLGRLPVDSRALSMG